MGYEYRYGLVTATLGFQVMLEIGVFVAGANVFLSGEAALDVRTISGNTGGICAR